VITILVALEQPSVFLKGFADDVARVANCDRFCVPGGVKELDAIINDGYFTSASNRRSIVTRLKSHYGSQKLRCCDNDTCEKKETLEEHFKFCSRCNGPRYCSVTCQRHHWVNGHNNLCFKKKM